MNAKSARASVAAELPDACERKNVARAMSLVRRMLPVAGMLLLPVKTFAFGVVLLYQGEVDDRELYFADLRTISNRTAPDQVAGPVEIRELDVTAVYESERKPEFVHMKLQFQCPSSHTFDRSSYKLTANATKIRAGDALTFRIGPGSYKLRRSDLKTEPVAVSEWKTSDAALVTRAGTIACNHIEIDRALHQSIKERNFDLDGFGRALGQLGLPSDMTLIGQTLSSEFLDFAWNQFWHDKLAAGKRPDPSGKWGRKPTEAEKAAAIRNLQEMQAKAAPAVDAARAGLLAGIQKSQAEMAARAGATRPDGKKLTPIESNLMILWRGRLEEEIVKVMGNPDFNQAGDNRFLRYTKYWEKPGVTLINGHGVPVGGEPGGYAECFVEFRTRQDGEGRWRVDDVLVRSNYQDAGLGRTRGLCEDLARETSR
jgi:hypothetical protein